MILALRDDTSRHDACRSLYGRSKARLPTGPASRPTRRGTCPIMVLTTRVDAGCSRRAGPPGQLTARELRQHRPPQLARRGSGGDPDSADRRLPADGGTGVDARSSPTQVEILDGQVYPQPSVP